MSKKRLKAPSASYHIFNRGVDGRKMFIDENDIFTFHMILVELIEEKNLNFVCHGYANMDNHFHLLVETFEEDISKIIYFLCFKYAMYFNKKNERKGYLFQDSFESRLILDNEHFKVIQAYIHNNWNEVSRSDRTNNMLYCSYQCFLKQKKIFNHLDIENSLNYYHPNKERSIKEFEKYTKTKLKFKQYIKEVDSDILFLALSITKNFRQKKWLAIVHILKSCTRISNQKIFEILTNEDENFDSNSADSMRKRYQREIIKKENSEARKALKIFQSLSHPSPRLD